ncbi:MAG: MBL fold metallo-hydrolase [Sphingomicrobium sp.]
MEPEFPISAYVCAPEWPLMRGGRWRRVRVPVRYGFFVHPVAGPVLIDTGYTTKVTTGKRAIDLWLYAAVLRPQLVEDAQLEPFLRARGFALEDVRAVVLTHFHADHISAARDLPNARFYASGSAYRQLLQWSHWKRTRHGVFLDLLPKDFEARLTDFENAAEVSGPLGLGACRDLFDDSSVLIVPLPGHAIGHVGVAFATLDPPLLYAADVEWIRGALSPGRSGLAARVVSHDLKAGKASSARALAFEQAGGRLVLCHDPEPAP